MRTIVKVAYKDRYRMVGKVFPLQGQNIFYHRKATHLADSDLDMALRGLDKEVVIWLDSQKVTALHHDQHPDELYAIPIGLFIALADERMFHGRPRLYVPKESWRKHMKCWYKQPFIHENECKKFGIPQRKVTHDQPRLFS